MNSAEASEQTRIQGGFRAEVKCPICKTTLAILENATFENAAELFKEHLPTHTLTQIYELEMKTGQLKYPIVEWDFSNKKKVNAS